MILTARKHNEKKETQRQKKVVTIKPRGFVTLCTAAAVYSAFFRAYTANFYRDLQGLCGGFLQYLQGKPCNIYRLQGYCKENHGIMFGRTHCIMFGRTLSRI